MVRIAIKPITLNKAYRGRRFKTPYLEDFKKELLWQLPRGLKIPEGNLKVKYEFGVSQHNVDGDNLVKCFQDCLADAYGFNDNRIYEWYIKKVKVKKGEEYTDFELSELSTP